MKPEGTQDRGIKPGKTAESDIRDRHGKGGLPCGARYCHRCHEECGVVVNAYIMRDLENGTDIDETEDLQS